VVMTAMRIPAPSGGLSQSDNLTQYDLSPEGDPGRIWQDHRASGRRVHCRTRLTLRAASPPAGAAGPGGRAKHILPSATQMEGPSRSILDIGHIAKIILMGKT
jgi:hypothetical protein